MARNETPPFERGLTLYNGDSIDTDNLAGADIIGKEWLFEDRNANTGLDRTNQYVKCRAVRNKASFSLRPKRLVRFSTTAGEYGNCVDGYNTTYMTTHDGSSADGTPSFPVDEYLPAAGVTTNDVFWIVVEGPAVCLTDIAAASTNVHSVGGRIAGLTAATSGATTAGRVQTEPALAAATSGVVDFTSMLDVSRLAVGRALTAKTTNNTNDDILVNVCRW